MPKVPTYDNFTVAPSTNPNVQVQSPEFQDFAAKQQQAFGGAIMNVGNAATRVGADMVQQANMVRIQDSTNKAEEAALALEYARPDKDGNGGGFLSVTGEAALNRASGKPLADEYKEKFQQRVDEISQGLGNDQQRRTFVLKANQIGARLYARATAHETEQFKTYTLSVQEGRMRNASNAILLDPLNPASVSQGLSDINDAIYVSGKLKGMSAQQIESTQREAVSGTHLAVIKSLLMPDDKGNTNTEGAKAYFDKFRDQIGGVQRAEAGKLVGAASEALIAQKSAADIMTRMGPRPTEADPTGFNQPFDIYKMEQAAREMFPNDPAKSKATIDELRSRKEAWDATQADFIADNVNKVRKMMALPLSRIEALPAFQTLPGAKQDEIRQDKRMRGEHAVSQAYMMEQRAEAAKTRKSFASYLDYSNPEKLAAMPRKQVEALWPTLGSELTNQLVSRWDALQNKETRLTESMDKAQFDAIAEDFQLKPFASGKSEADKATLGRIHYNVNQALEAEARSMKRPMTQAEKEQVMRREMAKEVTLDYPWYRGGNETARLPELTDDQIKRVIVPQAIKQQYFDKMKGAWNSMTPAQQKANPLAEPTDANIRYWFINDKKKGTDKWLNR